MGGFANIDTFRTISHFTSSVGAHGGAIRSSKLEYNLSHFTSQIAAFGS